MEPLCLWGTEFYARNLDGMMAAMHKNTLKSSSPEPVGRILRTFVFNIGLQSIVLCSNDGLGMTLTNFTAMSVLET